MSQDPPTPTPPRRVDGSMSLLVDMMANTLDEAYVERAARKAGDAPQVSEPAGAPYRRTLVTVGSLLAVGLVTGTAVAQVRGEQRAGVGLRGELAQEVQERTAESERLDGTAAALREELLGTREQALGVDAQGRALAERLEELGLLSATTPVTGPGIVVTLDDPAQDSELDAELRAKGTVRDVDLQDAVNALYAAGAEAVSVNGRRLTVLTAKRDAGGRILVDLLPLQPPYVVRAVGQPSALELGFLDGETGRRLSTYVSAYGMRLDVRRDEELELPGAADPTLRNAVPVPEASP